MKPTTKTSVVGALLLLLAVAALRDLSRLGDASPWRRMDDFADFYCAGWSLDHGANPYTYEPLHTCEHRVNRGNSFRGQLFASNPAVAVPAPLPSYDFPPFMAVARLPFWVARSVGAMGIVAAVILSGAALSALGIPWELCAAALALSTLFAELNTGQVIPFALLAIALAGLALARGRDALAGLCAALGMIEPAVGVPLVVATLLFVPRARLMLIATLLVFALIGSFLVGAPAAWTYVSRVIPAQAASEVHFPFQYSLTYVAAALGLPARVAVLVGTLSYLVMLAIGLAIAPHLAATLRRREMLVFLPVFCSTIAGSYLHQEELCVAIPALLVMAFALRGVGRVICALALCVLSIPWILVWGSKQLFLASLFVCAVILLRLQLELRITVTALCLVAAIIYVFELHPPHLPAPRGAHQFYATQTLVQTEWRWYAQQRSTDDPLWLAIKLPTWAALLGSLAVAGLCAKRYSVSTA